MSEKLIKIESLSQYRHQERPLSIEINGKVLKVAEILSSYIQETKQRGLGTKRFFKVRTEDNSVFLIYYDERLDMWFLKNKRR
jgi:hypothetical protein